MSSINIVTKIVDAMQPDMADYADNAQFIYWMNYATELDIIADTVSKDEDVVAYINKQIDYYASGQAQHHACVDVATTLESISPKHRGLFVYG